jgi:hypothetical protein
VVWGIVITGFTMVGMVVLVLLKDNLTVLAGTDVDTCAREAAALKVPA